MKKMKKLILALVCVCMTSTLVNVPVSACERQDSEYGYLPDSPMHTHWSLVSTKNIRTIKTPDAPKEIQGEFTVVSSTEISFGGNLYEVLDLESKFKLEIGAKVTLKIRSNRYDVWREYDEYYVAKVSGTNYIIDRTDRHCKVWKGHENGPWRIASL